eukprot:CAMPEP_0115878242 /NCGR_PEP_ID=MMETSP0287-20121206/26669_1 /TAXON_ID=412157 /ORGANISM="Chrysochromulina rotalis, Strain UIO044" /LENGTH=130 /DNA_ID=CAMNT_0003333845 /DNA_START=252 /DNA_END=641 /DNA_ORIENTATION=-
MQEDLGHQVAARIQVVEGRVLGKLDRVRRLLEDSVVRARVVVDVDHARLLDEWAHMAREGGLLSKRVDGVEVERGRAEDRQGAPTEAGVRRAQRPLHPAECRSPRRRAVERSKLRAEDDGIGTVAHRLRP